MKTVELLEGIMRIDINAHFGYWQYWDLPQHTADELVAMMDAHGIEQAACLSLRGVQLNWREGNDETLAAAQRHSKRLLAMATISPFLGGNADELRRLIDAGFRGVRLYPGFHNYPLDSAFVDDICRCAAERGVPVMIPTRPMMNWRFKAIPIESIGAVIERHPQTTFIVSGPNYLVEYQAVVKLMQRCANATYEISCMQGFDYLRNLVGEVGAERILFGTGAILHYPACNVAKLNGAKISSEQRNAIGYTNAQRLLKC